MVWQFTLDYMSFSWHYRKSSSLVDRSRSRHGNQLLKSLSCNSVHDCFSFCLISFTFKDIVSINMREKNVSLSTYALGPVLVCAGPASDRQWPNTIMGSCWLMRCTAFLNIHDGIMCHLALHTGYHPIRLSTNDYTF